MTAASRTVSAICCLTGAFLATAFLLATTPATDALARVASPEQAGPPASGTDRPQEKAGSEVGFRLEVQGTPDSVDPQRFAKAVLDALPEQLTDPDRNFTRHELYDADADYRVVLVFHGNDALDATTLCAVTAGDRAPATAPPAFETLTATTRVSAAFCKGAETLSSARDQMTGEVLPEQASFRFLVADVAKQLFPDGFDAIPGGTAATTAKLP